MTDQERDDILHWFSVDPFPGVYILGCFARYATLYSQQVRALNLVAALSGKIENAPVAVVGAGAAGLTASAAAALLGANVTLFEKLDGVMEIQRNNRQRWIHPHIYDWPKPDVDGDRARLPILDWQAGYAEVVAEQIEKQWQDISKRTGRIKTCYPLRDIRLSVSKRSPWLKWTSRDNISGNRAFQTVILAVGFGLEPDRPYRWSYWQEDDIDASFRTRGEGGRWLVSGYGDSSLTDLMRLCIKRFRHAELPILFADHDRDAVESVKQDLIEFNRNQRAGEASYVTEFFQRLETRGLEKALDKRLRRGFRPCLTGIGQYLYDPRASTLNRLILRLLEKLKAFDHLPGPVAGQPKRARGGVLVELPSGPEVFERVLLRHGSAPALDKKSFGKLPQAAANLETEWSHLRRGRDITRVRKWRTGFFGPEDAPPADAFQQSMKRLGITARSLTVTKELLSDGRSLLKYQIDGLKVLEKEELTGVRFRLESTVGVVGPPELDAVARQLGDWKPDPQPSAPLDAPMAERLKAARDRARILSGMLQFSTPLMPESEPVSFGFSIFQLNADALSAWEFRQLYRQDQRKHFDGSDIQDLEYFACMVWFPIETLKVRLTFPSGYPGLPKLSVFRCPADEVAPEEVVHQHVLHLSPKRGSSLAPSPKSPWKSVTIQPDGWTLHQSDVTKTWELQALKPVVGSCYSLDWDLPEPARTAAAQKLQDDARTFRQALIGLRNRPEFETVRRRFLAFSEEVRRLYRDPARPEWFEVAWMTYNDADHLLQPVDAVVNGEPPDEDLWEFKLPFGLGLAGASFKAAHAFVYVKPDRSETEYFLDVPGFSKAEVLVALPLDHPDFDDSSSLERNHQLIGVMDLSSNLPDSPLLRKVKSDGLDALADLCRAFSRDVYQAVMVS